MTPSSHIALFSFRFSALRGVIAGAFAFLFAGATGISSEDSPGSAEAATAVPEADHWALRPIARPDVPASSHPVDFFTGNRLEEAGLERNPAAEIHTLLRRATLDLTGLPPTRDEIRAFEEAVEREGIDPAWEALVDRLLASPHYGERWGRHWLDIARYVQGAIKVPGVDEIDLAEPYRDYVVRAFNSDKPYDRFLAEQLAGDLLAEEGESLETYFDRITAPAFLSIGQWFEECTDPNKLRLDIIDEQISTATRAFIAMDFACMRCHDGKYDPVPIADYYALAGIFRSTRITESFHEEWKDGRPRQLISLATPEESGEAADRSVEYVALLEKRKAWLEQMRTQVLLREDFESPGELNQELFAWEAEDFGGHKNLRTVDLGPGPAGPSQVIETRKRLDQWVKYRVVLEEPGDYTLLVRYASGSAVQLELEGEILPDRVLGDSTYGKSPEHFRWQPIPLRDVEKGSLHIRFLADRNEVFPRLDSFRLVRGILEPDDRSWRRQLGEPSLAEVRFYLDEEESKRLAQWDEQVASAAAAIPRFEQTLGVRDENRPIDLPVHIAGEVYRTESEETRRAVPTIAGAALREAHLVPDAESGRRQFARWLADPDHPLTARVMVNRIWHWHFGTGLVRTVDDFGRQGTPPTHPGLLDWLAAEFIESGWSIRNLHRIILTSETYRASSEETSRNRELDPDGALLSRYPARRLEVEAIYDGMLTSIGKVPRQEPGQPLDTSQSKDRALYILTSARSPMGLGIEIRKMFELFGFDDSGRPMHDRDESTTAQQALWWLNNPLPRHYAEGLAERILSETDDPAARVDAVHRIVLGRPPSSEGERAILTYLDEMMDQGTSETEAWTRVCLGLFSTEAFRTID